MWSVKLQRKKHGAAAPCFFLTYCFYLLGKNIRQCRRHNRLDCMHAVFRLHKYERLRAFKDIVRHLKRFHAKALSDLAPDLSVCIVEGGQAMHKDRICAFRITAALT